MGTVKIITDSCSDLTEELLLKYDIDYAKMSTFYNGVETFADLTRSRQAAHEQYEIMRRGGHMTTAQVSVEEFDRVFTKYLDQGRDIVYIACSSKQSGSVNTGFSVARGLMEKYPNNKIICIDSLNASLGEGMLAVEAAKLAISGASAEDIENRIVALRKKVNQFVTVHSLDALRRSGRVKATAAFFGNLMGVKPIIISDVNGYQTAIKKIRGRQNSFNEIVALLKQATAENAEGQTIYVAHADCSDDEADMLVGRIKEEIPGATVCVGLIGPIIGASIGPDAVGVWGIGTDVVFSMGD